MDFKDLLALHGERTCVCVRARACARAWVFTRGGWVEGVRKKWHKMLLTKCFQVMDCLLKEKNFDKGDRQAGV